MRSLPGGRISPSLQSPGPHMCSRSVFRSIIALDYRSESRPNSAGTCEFGIAGVSNVARQMVPSERRMARGILQLCVQLWLPLPIPLTSSGRSRRYCSGRLPCLIASLIVYVNHWSPVRFPNGPISSSRLGLPSPSRVVACRYGPYVRCELPASIGLPVLLGRLVMMAAGASSDNTLPIPWCHSRASLSEVGHTIY